ALENLQLQHPFVDRIVPIILGEHVTTESGTGNVHTAPAHGQDDYYVGLSYGLPIESPVNSRSCFEESTPLVGGQHVLKANQIIVDVLKEKDVLLHHQNIQHSYPHCWRHKTPVIFRATPQWFISMDQKGLRAKSLAAIKTAQWIPEWGEVRISNMVQQRPDWCISRQRAWGTPITLFMHKNTGELHPNTLMLMEKIAVRIDQEGMEAWFETTAEDWLGPDAKDYDKCTDTLDVWFDAGVNHYTVLEQRAELHAPADLYLEGSDQHRGWFQAALITSVAVKDEAPFKTVLTHGYVVDGKGKKMSKSIGNVVQAYEIVQKLGADILRLWVSASDYRDDVNFSEEILNRSVDAYRRIRNTARFLLANLFDFDPAKHLVHADQLVALDYWAIRHTQELQTKIKEAYDRYQFQQVYQLIHNFCAVELGSFYLDIIKDRQYTSKTDGVPRRSAQTAMFYILEALVRWLAPLCSFTADEIWQHMPGQRSESVFLSEWYEAWPNVVNNQHVQLGFWPWFMSIRDEVNKVLEGERNAGRIGSALQAEVILYVGDDYYQELSRLGEELRFALITSAAQVLPMGERDQEAKATTIDNLWVKINVIDAPKCVRCWQHRTDIGSFVNDPELCGRCVDNVAGPGEKRIFA
ncbi:MAG TPA: class I tRNA ligase family protein, partial [Coxiellaceae bacterium]|nr:class I tRNA ligase family protein [Coxiellaceae bacterium]